MISTNTLKKAGTSVFRRGLIAAEYHFHLPRISAVAEGTCAEDNESQVAVDAPAVVGTTRLDKLTATDPLVDGAPIYIDIGGTDRRWGDAV